jgi:hypothetical protein
MVLVVDLFCQYQKTPLAMTTITNWTRKPTIMNPVPKIQALNAAMASAGTNPPINAASETPADSPA